MTVTRYIHGQDDQPPAGSAQAPAVQPFAAHATRVYGGTTSYTHGADEVAQVQGASFTFSRQGTAGGSVIATLNPQGHAASVELIPGDASTRTDVATAQRLGVIRRSASGGWEDVPQEALQEAHEALAGQHRGIPQAEDPEFISQEAAQALQGALQGIPEHALARAQAQMVGLVAHQHGTVEGIAKSLAEATGLDPQAAQEKVLQVWDHYAGAAAKAMASAGLTAQQIEQAQDWLQANHPGHLQDAIQRLIHGRDADGFRTLAVQFKVQNPDAQALEMYRGAGFETSIDRQTGDILVRRDGGSWRSASDLASTEEPQGALKGDPKGQRNELSSFFRAQGFATRLENGELMVRRGSGSWVAAASLA